MRLLVELIFPKRLHRLAYFLRLLTSNIAIGLIFAFNSPSDQLFPILGAIALAVYQLFFVLLPRVRDTGMSGWWVVLSLVPVIYVFLGIILLFRAPEYRFERSSHEAEQT